jgi:hypothetical protein
MKNLPWLPESEVQVLRSLSLATLSQAPQDDRVKEFATTREPAEDQPSLRDSIQQWHMHPGFASGAILNRPYGAS